MATGSAYIDTGSTIALATNTISEDAITKHVGRSTLNKSDGTEVGLAASPFIVTLAGLGTGNLAGVTTIGSVALVATVNTVSAVNVVASIVSITSLNTVAMVSTVSAVNTVASVTSVGTLATVSTVSAVNTVAKVVSIDTLSTLSFLASANITSINSITTLATVTSINTLAMVSTVSAVNTVASVVSVNTVSTVTFLAGANIGSVGTVTTLATVNTVNTVSFVASANIGSVGSITTLASVTSINTQLAFQKTFKTKSLTYSVAGETALVAGVSAKLIKVYAISLVNASTAANTISFNSSASGTTVWKVPFVPGGVQGANLAVSAPTFLFASSDTNTMISIASAVAVTSMVSLSYWDNDSV